MGPLKGVKIIEFAGIGPGPFCAMLLSDMGAEVLSIHRKGAMPSRGASDILARGRRPIELDLKNPHAISVALALIEKADILIEGFRPQVMERLGLGADICLKHNPKLVYGRMTGWGQDGPLAQAAGHDINYIALTGLLHAVGRAGAKPAIPLNVAGDFGGGALYLAMGLCAALYEAKQSGKGQVVDAAMTDGSASLISMFYGMKASGIWQDERGANLIDGGAHFYDSYETSDGKYIALGSIEPQFYALMREKLGLAEDKDFDAQMERDQWQDLKAKITAIVKTKSREEWCQLMEGSDVCFAPILSLEEAPHHPHNRARKTFIEIEGVMQPNVAPRFSRTQSEIQSAPSSSYDTQILHDWGIAEDKIQNL